MTVIDTTNTVRKAGNGAKVAFDFLFKIFRIEDIEAFKIDTSVDPEVETLQVLNVDYTVVINPTAEGGTVTYTVAPLATEDSFLRRTLDLNQETKIPREANFPEQQVNNENDRSRMIDIQIQEQLDRAVLLPIGSGVAGITFPPPLADAFIGWDPTGTFLLNLPDPSVSAAAAAVAAAASAAAAAVSEGNAATSATNSATSASNSATSETNAATSASAALVSEIAAAASAATIALPALPAGGDLNLQTNPAGTAYVLAALGTGTVVDDFTIKNPLGIIEVNPNLVTAIVANRMAVLALGDLTSGGFTDGVADTYTNELGIDLGASADQIFEGGSYRTPAPIQSEDTKLLLNATAYNGALEVLDLSTNDHIITQIGNATLSPNYFNFGNGALCLDGVDQTLTIPNSTDFDLFAVAVNSFTLDQWIKFNVFGSLETIITHGSATDRWEFRKNADNSLEMELIVASSSVLSVISAHKITDNEWHHITVSKIGQATPDYGIYFDGFQIGFVSDASLGDFTDTLYIGSLTDASNYLDGYIDDLRITNNNAFSAVPIDKPFLHFTLDDNAANTTVLDFGSGANNGTAVSGNTEDFHKSGKIRFGFDLDGVADRVSVNAIASIIDTDTTGTIMAWINPDVLVNGSIFSIGASATVRSGMFRLTVNGAMSVVLWDVGTLLTVETDSTTVAPINVWTHVAVVQDGVAIQFYINGAAEASTVSSGTGDEWFGNLGGTINRGSIGALDEGGIVYNYFNGRLDDVRYYQNTVLTQTQVESIRVAGVAGVYGLGSPNITVPTTAHTDDANTLLLLPFDSTTQGNDLIDISTGGGDSPHTITSVAGVGVTGKFSSSYLSFDGTGDYLTVPDAASLDLGTADFSISTWVRSKADGSIQYYFHKRTGASSGELEFFKDASDQLVLSTDNGGAVVATSTATLDDRNWHFILAVRVGNDLGVYLDTAQIAFATGSIENMTSTGLLFIGADVATANGHNGDMDDYHVSNANPLGAVPVVGLTDTITLPISQQAVVASTRLLINANTQDESLSIQIPTFNGASVTSAQSQFGGFSYAFDGTNDDISFAHKSDWNIFVDNKTDKTIQMWVRHTDHAGTETYMAHTLDANNNWVIEHVDGSGMRFIATVGGVAVITLPFLGEITDSNFHHVVLSIIGTENPLGAVYQMYLDGTQINYIQDNSAEEFIGSLYLGSNGLASNYFDGNIDGIEIVYNNIFAASVSPGVADSITVPVVAPSVDSTIGVITLQSIATTALAQPDDIKIYFDLENIDPTVVLNTDIVVSVSRDGGTTFTAATMVTSVGGAPRRIIEDTVDVTGQPAGTGVVYKVETFNNIQMRLHSVSELWD